MKSKQIISDAGAVIIIDWPRFTEESNEHIVSLLKRQQTKNGRPLYLINEIEEVTKLKEEINNLNLSLETTLFIYPGESAQYIQELGFSEGYTEEMIHAKRQWSPESKCDPIITVGHIQPQNFINYNIENIVVVDDVVSSGITVSKVYRNNSWKFPRAKWSAVTLCSRKERLPYFQDIYCSFVIKDINGKKPPINSLSTLIKNPGIRNNYLERNFKNSKELIITFEEQLTKKIV